MPAPENDPQHRQPGLTPPPDTSPSASSVRLLDIEPDIGAFLTAEQRQAANQVQLRVRTTSEGNLDVYAIVAKANAFGTIVLDGMLLRRMRIGDHRALRLLGPGDLLLLSAEPRTSLLEESGCIAHPGSRLALLNNEILIAAHRWPALVTGLLTRLAEQSERIALQLTIAHLPRVDDRLLAIMRLIAERWGSVTPDGTVVPLRLTHEVLGGLIGARRSSVTLALGELVDSGALVKHDRGWLLPHQ